jgi:type II secretory pathway pseudopilin PulG
MNVTRPNITARRKRRGMTMLELVFASALLTTLVTAVAVLVRGGYAAWQAHSGDYVLIEAANATLRHMVRNVRQATAVTKISGSGTGSVKLEVTMPSGQTYAWERKGSNNEVDFGIGSANNFLADGITNLYVTGYQADGTTVASSNAAVRAVKLQVQFQLPRDTGGTRLLTSWVWLRAW